MMVLSEENAESRTLVDAVREILDVGITHLSQKRFTKPGWFYAGPTLVRCQRDDVALQAFRKSYMSGGRQYFYVACVCTGCLSAVSVAELGIQTNDLGLRPPAPSPAHDPRGKNPIRPDAVEAEDSHNKQSQIANACMFGDGLEDLEFNDLVVACLDSLPDARMRTVLSVRLGLGGDDPSLAGIAQDLGISPQRVSQLQQQGVALLAELARNDPSSHCHRLRIELGLSTPPDHLEIARRMSPRLRFSGVESSHRKVTLWLLIAGALPSCARHVSEMVVHQMQATADWEKTNSRPPTASRARQTLDTWLGDIEWPSWPRPGSCANISPIRKRGETTLSGSVYVTKAGREVSYESSLERKFFSLLDRVPDVKGFVEQPCRIEYEFEGRSRRYYPDVLVELTDGRMILVEVKDVLRLVDAENLAKYESARAYAHRRGWGWAVCTVSSLTLSTLRGRAVQPHILKRFRERLEAGPIDARTLKALKSDTAHDGLDVLSMSLQQGWTMKHSPFRLSK